MTHQPGRRNPGIRLRFLPSSIFPRHCHAHVCVYVRARLASLDAKLGCTPVLSVTHRLVKLQSFCCRLEVGSELLHQNRK